MSTATAIWGFSLAAALLTITPGLDTALVLRTAAAEGSRRAFLAGSGIAVGVLVWGTATAVGLAELLRTSAVAYETVRWAGAAYLLYLGARMVVGPRTDLFVSPSVDPPAPQYVDSTRGSAPNWFMRGLMTNLLNPKVGLFYVSFLPQFIPQDAVSPKGLMLLFAAIHAVEGVLWFAVLILATDALAPVLRRRSVMKSLDRAMGTLFIAVGVKLAIERRP